MMRLTLWSAFRCRNIVANPLVELQDGAVKQGMRAREVFGEEKDE
jgi:hypothetical protein